MQLFRHHLEHLIFAAFKSLALKNRNLQLKKSVSVATFSILLV